MTRGTPLGTIGHTAARCTGGLWLGTVRHAVPKMNEVSGIPSPLPEVTFTRDGVPKNAYRQVA